MRPTRSQAPTPSRMLLAALILSLAWLGPALAQEGGPPSEPGEAAETAEPVPPPVSIEAVVIEPDDPGPETLCRLTVTLRNRGERPMSAFGFDVAVAGHPLPVYDNQLFLQALGAGESVELPLYNFWTSETGRPAPADGRMAVEVTLREARWMTIGEEDGVEVWKLEEPVDGVPVSAQTLLELKK